MSNKWIMLVILIALALVLGPSGQLPPWTAYAQDESGPAITQQVTAPQAQAGTSFTYQGRLTDGGSPANGEYDFLFKVYDVASEGSDLTVDKFRYDVPVTEGLFTVQIDFGDTVFAGDARWLEIAVRPGASTGDYTTLAPRQELTPVPYALALPGLRTQQNATCPNIIGGHSDNSIAGGEYGATIGGGQGNDAQSSYTSIGGGRNNDIGTGCTSSSIAGGQYNNIVDVSYYSTIGGGQYNDIRGGSNEATIGGGGANDIEDSSDYATIGGGAGNLITSAANYATIPGGLYNEVGGSYGFAAGRRAKSNNNGCYVWGDSTNEDIACNDDNRTIFRSTGGFYIYTDNAVSPSGLYLAAGGSSWNTHSDRNVKENLNPVDAQQLLANLAQLPITTWNYKSQDPSIRHIGPMAQDFNTLLPDLGGEGQTYINTLDADGVALAAIQGLYTQNQDLSAENSALQEQLDELEARVTALEQADASLVSVLGPSSWQLLGGLVLVSALVLQRRRVGGVA